MEPSEGWEREPNEEREGNQMSFGEVDPFSQRGELRAKSLRRLTLGVYVQTR